MQRVSQICDLVLFQDEGIEFRRGSKPCSMSTSAVHVTDKVDMMSVALIDREM